MCSLLNSSMGQSLKVKIEEFKRKIASLDKEHAKEFKKVHHNIKRKLDFLRKLERKSSKEIAQGLRKEPISVAGKLCHKIGKKLS
jgi:IRSp53/MIM homology domain